MTFATGRVTAEHGLSLLGIGYAVMACAYFLTLDSLNHTSRDLIFSLESRGSGAVYSFPFLLFLRQLSIFVCMRMCMPVLFCLIHCQIQWPFEFYCFTLGCLLLFGRVLVSLGVFHFLPSCLSGWFVPLFGIEIYWSLERYTYVILGPWLSIGDPFFWPVFDLRSRIPQIA